MLKFNIDPIKVENCSNKDIFVFGETNDNIDLKTVDSFGEEWQAFSNFTMDEIQKAGDQYFDIVDDDWIQGKNVLDVGCGTGRWSKYVVDKAESVDAIDPSKAVYAAANLLKKDNNVRVSKASADNIPFADNSFDLVFSLGVLHHIPDTAKAMKHCVDKLKSGGHFLVYLYYDFEQRGLLFKSVFYFSSVLRYIVSKLPVFTKKMVCELIALFIYGPFILFSKLLENLGLEELSGMVPLSYYKSHSWHIVRNDALDRFGTPLEQRFSRVEIKTMMQSAGLIDIKFSDNVPYWHAIGRKK